MLVYVTHPDEETACALADKIVRERLAACANIHAMQSNYWWLGNLENSNEWVTLFKTNKDAMPQLEKRLLELHPYEVPCIMRWEVQANTSYDDWIHQEVKES